MEHTENNDAPAITRRHALKLVGATGFTALTGCSSQPKEPPYIPAGDTSGEINQEEVNATYRDMDKRITEALATANGRKVVVLGGHTHANMDELACELMLLNIARGRIPKAHIETDDEGLKVMKTGDARFAEKMEGFKRDIAMKASLDGVKDLSPEVKEAAAYVQFMSLAGADKNDPIPTEMRLYFKALQNGTAVGAGDPKREGVEQAAARVSTPVQQSFDIPTLLGERRENGMVDALMETNGPAIGFYGASHLPALIDKLKERGAVVVAFNVSNVTATQRAPKEFRERLESLNNYPESQNIVINGREADSPAHAATLAAKAAFANHAPKEGIDIVNKLLDKAMRGAGAGVQP